MKNRIKLHKIIIIAILVLTSIISFSTQIYAGTRMPKNIMIKVNDNEEVVVRAISVSYQNNIYISIRDVATAMSGTSASFNAEVTISSLAITTGEDYVDEYSHAGFAEEELKYSAGQDPILNEIKINGDLKKYFTVIMDMGGYYDCFISPMDLAMMLDIAMDYSEDSIIIDTDDSFEINPAKMEGYGYFEGVNCIVVGDATTGEIFYGYRPDDVCHIASTTKLMTYLLTMDAVHSGQIGENDLVTISEHAAKLSSTQDGAVAMSAGWQIPLKDLITGALLPSSNECALALSEYVAGSEEAFVELMNRKAEELSMTTARFYNTNGLPVYTDTIIPAKKQNHMSARDMFTMTAHILNTYPEVKSITSMRETRLDSLSLDIKNTNGLLYNMPEVNGLKTGTTDKSGACLITSLTVNDGSMDHDLVVVELGAENSQTRLRASELMARYAKAVVLGKAAKISYSPNEESGENEGKVSAETIVKMVVDYALKK